MMRVTLANKIGESGMNVVANWDAGNVLYDLVSDPAQTTPIDAPEIEARLADAISEHFEAHDAPDELYAHYGLARAGGERRVGI